MSKAIALYDFKASADEDNELTVKKNEMLDIIQEHEGWWMVKNIHGKSGLVPVDYLAAPVTEDMKVTSRGKTKEAHTASSEDEMNIAKDCQVAILDQNDGYWWLVGFAGKTGYVPKQIIKVFKKQSSSFSEQGKYNLKEVAPAKAFCDEMVPVLFSFQKPLPPEGKLVAVFKGEHCEKVVDVEKINDFTLKAVAPKYYPPECTKVCINHQKPGQTPKTITKGIDFTFESRLDVVHKTLAAEADPINFLCSSFQIERGDLQNVDHILSGILQKKVPEGVEVFKSKPCLVVQREANPKQTPTLLHFAAYYNLKKLAKSLLKCPGAQDALLVKNCHGMGATALAEFRKNNELKALLQDEEAESRHDDSCEDFYTSMESCYELYISMDGGRNGGYVTANSHKGIPEEGEEELYEDMEPSRDSPEQYYDAPRASVEDRFEDYDENEKIQKEIDEYKVFGKMSEKEVQLALLMKRVKERYITQEQALEMAKVLHLSPEDKSSVNHPPPTKRKPIVTKRNSGPVIDELNKKLNPFPRTSSTSSGSSISSVGSTASAGSTGYSSEEFGHWKHSSKSHPAVNERKSLGSLPPTPAKKPVKLPSAGPQKPNPHLQPTVPSPPIPPSRRSPRR